MSHDLSMARLGAHPHEFDVNTITTADLREALRRGLDDFMANPTHLIFLSVIYPVVGLILARFTAEAALLPLIFPLVAGFAIIGPFAAIGLYDLSRRREQGLSATWQDAFQAFRSPAIGSILALGLMLMAIFLLWLGAARSIYQATVGAEQPASFGAMISDIISTPQGWLLIIIGNGVGFLFAAVAFTLSVVSFPLLLDRNVGVGAAIQTSIRAVMKNRTVMTIWAAIVVGGLILGSIPLLIGLALVMPILGHATWHLYRLLVPQAATR